MERFARTELMFGRDAVQRLWNSRVIVFGVGGVGGYVVEALTRSGIGTIGVVDNDSVCLSNLNRQIIATEETIGQLKVDAAEKRIHSISPMAHVRKYPQFYLPETADTIDLSEYDYAVDAIDTVKGKIEIAERCAAIDLPIISSMGMGNKVDPTMIRVADISKTKVCPLARVMRCELRKRGITHLKAVYSEEQPFRQLGELHEETERRSTPGSNAFVPSAAGLVIAAEVVKDLINIKAVLA